MPNCLDSYQDQQNVGPGLDPNPLTKAISTDSADDTFKQRVKGLINIEKILKLEMDPVQHAR